MAETRRPNLSPEVRQAVKDAVERFPELSYRQIGERFKLTAGHVSNILNPYTPPAADTKAVGPRPKAEPVKARGPIVPNAMPGLSLAQLMGGRAPRAKLQPA